MRKARTYQTIKQNTYRTLRKALTSQTVNKTHTKQCARHYSDKKATEQKNKCATLERNKQSTEHIQNSARGTNVTNSPIEHV